ncbi:protein max isoform X2 [Culicoides brevitarsis]|uniref:protein max isoform X2 n=1 Tax=Culicoides brevitarsis TaxID=469753 RepID=UPI00307C18E8
MRFTGENPSAKANQFSNMSHEDDVDLSDDGDDSDSQSKNGSRQAGGQYFSQAEKRAHHNALERKRRDHIKDSFTSLRDSVPSLQGEKASRAQILKKAAEYIQFMRRKNSSHQQDIDDLKRQNSMLETQIRTLERARTTGNFDAAELGLAAVKSESESSEEGDEAAGVAGAARRSKKLKPNTYVG